MSEQTTEQAATSQLAALLAQMQAAGVATSQAAPAANGWNKPAAVAPTAEVLGVSIPISLDTPAGKLRVYLNFPGSCASSPAALMALVEQLAQSGMPLDAWQPKQQGSGWGGGNNRSGYNSNRGNGNWGR